MRPLIVIGTRPEAIKLAPVARAFPEADVVLTGQHPAEMVMPTLEYFGVPVAAKRNHIAGLALPQSFAQAFGWLASRVGQASCVIGQGDTTTAAAAAQAAFYAGVPFVHVEAGLRTYDATPYPEEFNRRLCALAAMVHCCPTERAAENLRSERVGGRIEVTGNTVVDAIEHVVHGLTVSPRDNPLVLITCHRRENFGDAFNQICRAVEYLSEAYIDVEFIWSAHPNPSARPPAFRHVKVIPPPQYADWVGLMNQASLIVTDSGGIQEEAAILDRPCLVIRDSTERPESIECGACKLIAGVTHLIVCEAGRVLDGKSWPIRPHPFGDGKSGERIAKIVRELTNSESCQPSNAQTATR